MHDKRLVHRHGDGMGRHLSGRVHDLSREAVGAKREARRVEGEGLSERGAQGVGEAVDLHVVDEPTHMLDPFGVGALEREIDEAREGLGVRRGSDGDRWLAVDPHRDVRGRGVLRCVSSDDAEGERAARQVRGIYVDRVRRRRAHDIVMTWDNKAHRADLEVVGHRRAEGERSAENLIGRGRHDLERGSRPVDRHLAFGGHGLPDGVYGHDLDDVRAFVELAGVPLVLVGDRGVFKDEPVVDEELDTHDALVVRRAHLDIDGLFQVCAGGRIVDCQVREVVAALAEVIDGHVNALEGALPERVCRERSEDMRPVTGELGVPLHRIGRLAVDTERRRVDQEGDLGDAVVVRPCSDERRGPADGAALDGVDELYARGWTISQVVAATGEEHLDLRFPYLLGGVGDDGADRVVPSGEARGVPARLPGLLVQGDKQFFVDVQIHRDDAKVVGRIKLDVDESRHRRALDGVQERNRRRSIDCFLLFLWDVDCFICVDIGVDVNLDVGHDVELLWRRIHAFDTDILFRFVRQGYVQRVDWRRALGLRIQGVSDAGVGSAGRSGVSSARNQEGGEDESRDDAPGVRTSEERRHR